MLIYYFFLYWNSSPIAANLPKMKCFITVLMMFAYVAAAGVADHHRTPTRRNQRRPKRLLRAHSKRQLLPQPRHSKWLQSPDARLLHCRLLHCRLLHRRLLQRRLLNRRLLKVGSRVNATIFLPSTYLDQTCLPAPDLIQPAQATAALRKSHKDLAGLVILAQVTLAL